MSGLIINAGFRIDHSTLARQQQLRARQQRDTNAQQAKTRQDLVARRAQNARERDAADAATKMKQSNTRSQKDATRSGNSQGWWTKFFTSELSFYLLVLRIEQQRSRCYELSKSLWALCWILEERSAYAPKMNMNSTTIFLIKGPDLVLAAKNHRTQTCKKRCHKSMYHWINATSYWIFHYWEHFGYLRTAGQL